MKYQVTIHPTPKTSSICAVFTNRDDATLFIDYCKKYDAENNVNWQYSLNELQEAVMDDNCNMDEPLTVASYRIVNTSTIIAFIRSMTEVGLFLEAKFAFDADHNIRSTYYIFDGTNLVGTHDKSPSVSQQAEKQKVFRPTPLPRKLRLGPGGYWEDPDDSENK